MIDVQQGTPEAAKVSQGEPKSHQEVSKDTLDDSKDTLVEPKVPKKRGRPSKKTLATAKAPRGRPRGDNSAIAEYKQRMLASPKSHKVLESIFNAALDDNHKGQQAAWKLIIDRIAPLAAFEHEITKGSGRNAITINISGIGGDVGISGDQEYLAGSGEQSDSGALEGVFTPVVDLDD